MEGIKPETSRLSKLLRSRNLPTAALFVPLVVLAGVLIAGCKPAHQPASPLPSATNDSLPIEEGAYFVDVTAHVGIDYVHSLGDGQLSNIVETVGSGAAFLDYDQDGYLDLYVANGTFMDGVSDGENPGRTAQNRLYHNRHGTGFEDVTDAAGVADQLGYGMGVAVADYDNDGYPDIYVANDAMANYLYHNEAGTGFRETGLLAGVAFSEGGEETSSMAVDFADYNSDGRLDLFVTDIHFSALYRNEGSGLFTDVTVPAGIAAASGQYDGWGASFFDYDNDGDVDIFKANGDLNHLFGQEDQLFENLGGGQFQDVSVERGSYFLRELVGRGAAFGDYDNDGDIDVFIVNLNDAGVLLRNESLDENNWLEILLVGSSSNRDGVGARVTVTTKGTVQIAQKKSSGGYLSTNDPRMHFGLGKSTLADSIEIRWPSGKTQVLENVRAGQILTISEQ